MSSKLIYVCDICGNELKHDSYERLENDVFGLEEGDDVCYECHERIKKAIQDMKDNLKWKGFN